MRLDGPMTLRMASGAPLYDGTPRREKGARAFLDCRDPDTGRSIVLQSPLLRSASTAERWGAFMTDRLAEGADHMAAISGWAAFAARWSKLA